MACIEETATSFIVYSDVDRTRVCSEGNLAMVCRDIIFHRNLLPYLVLQAASNRIPNIILTDPRIDGYNENYQESKSVTALRIMAFLRLDLQGGKKRTPLNLLQDCHRLESSEPGTKYARY
jgi:hypothetical protein